MAITTLRRARVYIDWATSSLHSESQLHADESSCEYVYCLSPTDRDADAKQSGMEGKVGTQKDSELHKFLWLRAERRSRKQYGIQPWSLAAKYL